MWSTKWKVLPTKIFHWSPPVLPPDVQHKSLTGGSPSNILINVPFFVDIHACGICISRLYSFDLKPRFEQSHTLALFKLRAMHVRTG